MMIAKRPAERNFNTQPLQRAPEGVGRAEPAKSAHPGEGRRSTFEPHPLTRNHAAAEDWRGLIVAADQLFDAGDVLAGLDTSDDDDRGARHVLERFAKTAQGKHAARERIEGIDQNDVFVALETNVLESVIEQEDGRPETCPTFHLAAHFEAVRADADVS